MAEITDESITYAPTGVWVDPSAPGFTGTRRRLTDEELVRAYLLSRLTGSFGYRPSHKVLEMERVYKSVGLPGKGGRVDVLVRQSGKSGNDCFLFIECKTPETYDRDLKNIGGQLFRLSLQEQPRPKYLLYYTADLRDGELRDRLILIDTATYPDKDSWDSAGQPIIDAIPANYGRPRRKLLANISRETNRYKPLDRNATTAELNRLREDLHNVIWGGGGTHSNEVFTYIAKLILCKIYDEQEALPGEQFRFQRLGDEVEPESPLSLVERMNGLYREAEESYLALSNASEGPAFDPGRLSPEKLAYVVVRLERLSITENAHRGDLLGEFFEQIVSRDFTQTKGQFFTPIKLVRFMLALCDAAGMAERTMKIEHDSFGRPRLPYVIDPSCGSGSFLIEYMRHISEQLGSPGVAETLSGRVRQHHKLWFGVRGNAWAREYIFGIENNYDLGLAAKVNMVLHGDGSMNTWIASGLMPFSCYWLDGRNNILGSEQEDDDGLYPGNTNDQFDLVVSNPPFSLKMSPDDEDELKRTLPALSGAPSEGAFIERWYQLLRDGGWFCCVLPETILESTKTASRLFLYQFFRIKAVVSLPYDAFRPFTSTKTCIVLAQKRTRAEARLWKDTWDEIARSRRNISQKELFLATANEVGWADTPIFMADPSSVGYKRRKGQPDLQTNNELYAESADGSIDTGSAEHTVLGSYLKGDALAPSPQLGFWTDLRHIGRRRHLRLDPKYRWLWDYQDGVVHGDPASAQPLSDFLELVKLSRVKKGELDTARTLIDLEHVESRQASLVPDTLVVEEIGSEKVLFKGCELAISKLEPYLAKVLINPPQDAIGSPEWIGLRRITDLPLELVAHILMLPALCDGYKRLQSGKRHARFLPQEFLDLRVQLPDAKDIPRVQQEIVEGRQRLIALRGEVIAQREAIDSLFQKHNH